MASQRQKTVSMVFVGDQRSMGLMLSLFLIVSLFDSQTTIIHSFSQSVKRKTVKETKRKEKREE